MAANVELEVLLRIDESLKELEKFSKKTAEETEKIGNNFKKFGLAAKAAIASFVTGELVDFLKSASKAAAEDEVAFKKLATALELSGDASASSLQDFADFSNEMQRNVGIADDVIASQLALAKSYGLTNKEAKDLVKAAADLAAVQGTDLNTAVEQLAKTYNGFKDKSLAKLIPEVNQLTKEQLAAGEAVRLLTERFGGAGLKNTETFAGSINKLSLAYGDLLENIGKSINQSEATKAVISALTKTFIFLSENVDLVAKAFDIIAGAMVKVVKIIPQFSTLSSIFETISFFTKDSEKETKKLVRTYAELEQSTRQTSENFAKQQRLQKVASEELQKEIEKITEKYKKSGADQLQNFRNVRDEELKILQKSLDAGLVSSKEAAKLRSEIELKFAEETEKERLKLFEDEKKRIQEIASNGISFLIDFKKGDTDGLFAGIAGSFAQVLRGAQGATDAVASVFGAIGDKVLPGIGGTISEIVKVFAKGPEEVKKFISEFAAALPEVIANVFESLPAVIEVLVDKAPEIIEKLVEKSPAIAFKLAEALVVTVPVKLAEKIGQAVGKVFQELGKFIERGAAEFFNRIVQAGNEFFNQILQLPAKLIEEIRKGIENIFSGLNVPGLQTGTVGGGAAGSLIGSIIGGPVGGFLGGIGGGFGFAKGGIIPEGFPNDSFPARLTSGELVIPPNDTDRLSQFLDRQQANQFDQESFFNRLDGSSEKNVTVVLNVGEEQLARVLLNLNRRGFRTA